MKPNSKYHKERGLAIARLRIPIVEQIWGQYWETVLATAPPKFPPGRTVTVLFNAPHKPYNPGLLGLVLTPSGLERRDAGEKRNRI
jgi:hypothetical protein